LRRHVAGEIQVAIDSDFVERAHREARDIEPFVSDLPIDRHREGAVERVGTAGEPLDLPARGLAILRLVQHLAAPR
jgi:hypothetical protein